MKARIVLAVLFLVGCARAQEINWKPCQDVIAPMKAAVEKFNAHRTDGFSIWLSCTLGASAAEEMAAKRPRHILLTPTEIVVLHRLREESTAAFHAQESYEKLLILKHGVKNPKIGDPCYRYVGIVADEDFITDDRNPMMPGAKCPESQP